MPRPRKLPHLSEYIRYAVDWRQRRLNLDLSPIAVAAGIALSLVVGVVAAAAGRGPQGILLGIVACVAVVAIYMIFAFRISLSRERRTADPEVRLRREALQVAERLEGLLNSKRLDRDLSLEVATLLDEAARSWKWIRTALQSPYWRRADLAAPLRSVREQSLLAADQGMQELLVLFATAIPERPGQWTFSEIVDEVVGHDFLTFRGKMDHISPFHEQGRDVAHKLKELASQVEDMSRRLAGEELVLGGPRPGSALDATLAELRQIKQAEDELRQDLRSG